MSIRYAQPENVCVICGIRTRGLPCPTCIVDEKVEDNMIKTAILNLLIILMLVGCGGERSKRPDLRADDSRAVLSQEVLDQIDQYSGM